MANVLSTEKRQRIFKLLCEGNGVRSIARIIGCSVNTIQKLQRELYYKVCDWNDRVLIGVPSKNIEADELKTFVLKRGKGNRETGTGAIWVYVALDRDSRMIIDFHVGMRDTTDAKLFLEKVSGRLKIKTVISTDCLKSYVAAVKNTSDDQPWTEDGKIDLLRARSFGDGRAITNRIETHNGVIRQHVSRLARRTRCYSKDKSRLIEHLTLFFFYYNFIKKQRTLGKTPAEQAGIISMPQSIETLISMGSFETKERGTYKRKEDFIELRIA